MLFGGAARGGKTFASLMAAAQYVRVPGYSALLLRENWSDLMQPGAFIPVSKEWWLGKASWSEQQKRWTFPSGATITFGYLERDDDVYQYQGAQYQCIIPDELTHHTEWRYRYLFSRLSRPADGPLAQVPLRMRPTANPGGRGHAWVKKRFIDPRTREPGAVFVPARVEDNLGVDQGAYIQSLSYLDPLTRRQLLDGDWEAVEGGLFKAEWFGSFHKCPDSPDYLITSDGERFRWADRPRWQTCDPNASATADADRFVLSTWLATPKGRICWVGCELGRYEIQDQVKVCQKSYRRWTPAFVAVEVVANQRALAQLLRDSKTPMMNVHSVNPKGKKKRERSAAAVVLAASGRLLLPEGCWDFRHFPLDDVISELVTFTGEEGRPDDIADTLFYAADVMGLVGAEESAGSAPTHGSVPGGTRR